MRRSLLRSLLLSMAAALALPHSAQAQQVIDLDAKVYGGSTPLRVPLGAGCWKITPVAGLYTAWHAWNGVNAGCDPTGAGCRQGWATLFFVGKSTGTIFRGAGFYANQQLAFANSTSSTFWLPQPEVIGLGVADNNLVDNLGGVSLLLEPMPGCANPAALAAYGSGTSGAGGVPSLGASGMPTLGDLTFQVELTSGAASAPLAWVIGLGRGNTALPAWGAVLLVQPLLFTLPDATDANGDAALPIPLDCTLSPFCGAKLTVQAAVLDAAATGGVAFSDAVEMTVGS